jgi:hypothetical protein
MEKKMSEHARKNDNAGITVLAVIFALIFSVILFNKFVEWVGPYSGGLSSPEVGKDISPRR